MPIGYHFDVPNNFTGIHVDNQNNKHWFRNGKRHLLYWYRFKEGRWL